MRLYRIGIAISSVIFTSCMLAGQDLRSEDEVKLRCEAILGVLGESVPPAAQWEINRTEVHNKLNQLRFFGWVVYVGSWAIGVNPRGRVTMISNEGPRASSNSQLSVDELWRKGESINGKLVGDLPRGWRKGKAVKLDEDPKTQHLPEAKMVIDLTWRDGASFDSEGEIVLRLRRDTGELVRWRGFVPRSYGPEEPSLSVEQAREKLRNYAAEITTRFPEDGPAIESAITWCEANPPSLRWLRGGEVYHYASGRQYFENDQLRLAYAWNGAGVAVVDANTGELFDLGYLGPPKGAPSNVRAAKRSIPSPNASVPGSANEGGAKRNSDSVLPSAAAEPLPWGYPAAGGGFTVGLIWFIVRKLQSHKT